MSEVKYKTSPLKWAGSKNKVLPMLLPILEKYKSIYSVNRLLVLPMLV